MRDVLTAPLEVASGWSTSESLEVCRSKINTCPFKIRHDLVNSPLFEVRELAAMASKAKNVHCDAGTVDIDDRWGDIPVPDMPVEEVISRIENNGAWVILKEMEGVAPGYKQVLDDFSEFVYEVAGSNARQFITKPEMLVIISSPGRLTPFHFDAEVNFLIQIHGDKRVWICDPMDRTVVTDADLEEYYHCYNPGTYRPGVEERAQSYFLAPGEGIHIPRHAAHWVRNGDGISVSLSLNFELESGNFQDVLRANRLLRKLGIRPVPPGRYAWRDELKHLAVKSGMGIARGGMGLKNTLVHRSGK